MMTTARLREVCTQLLSSTSTSTLLGFTNARLLRGLHLEHRGCHADHGETTRKEAMSAASLDKTRIPAGLSLMSTTEVVACVKRLVGLLDTLQP